MRILIGIPTFDRRIDIELVRALIYSERRNKYDFDYIFPVSSHLSRNRNMVVHEALKEGHDCILFLDSDIGITDDQFLDKLLETAYKFDAKIVGGAYLMKKPTSEIVYIAGENIKGKLDNLRKHFTQPRLVDAVGTGIMLVFREVFEKMEDPWFTILDKPKLDVLPEDFYFCEKAKKLGFNIAIDPRFDTNHWGLRTWSHSENMV